MNWAVHHQRYNSFSSMDFDIFGMRVQIYRRERRTETSRKIMEVMQMMVRS